MSDTAIRDLSPTWPAPPEWPSAELVAGGIACRTVVGLTQHLVSGDLAAYAAADGLCNTGIGALGLAEGDRYAARLARDRMLVVNADRLIARAGWYSAGFAVTDVSAAFHVFSLSGPGLDRLLAEALMIDPDHGGPSASVTFAGQASICYRHGDAGTVRLHVERGFATALWNWLEARQEG